MTKSEPRRRLREDEIVRKFHKLWKRGAWKSSGLALGPGDDAALLSPNGGKQQILSCDWFLEGTHFLRGLHPPEAVGWKCLARAISDVAAMGGAPRVFLLSMALPDAFTSGWLDGFLRGLSKASRRLGCVLAGGDTSRFDRVVISVTVIGAVPVGHALVRSGAQVGDLIYVSGALGGAEAGLRRLRSARGVAKAPDPAIRKHLYPKPRLALGQWLAANRMARAAMDISDGLSTDLARLCAASSVGALVDASRIPVARGADLQSALNGGDDYELLFTIPPARAKRMPKKVADVPVAAIGEIIAARKILLRKGSTVGELRPGGWDPFGRS